MSFKESSWWVSEVERSGTLGNLRRPNHRGAFSSAVGLSHLLTAWNASHGSLTKDANMHVSRRKRILWAKTKPMTATANLIQVSPTTILRFVAEVNDIETDKAEVEVANTPTFA